MATTQERALKIGLRKMAEWASAYVEGETVIPEQPMEKLAPEEVAALALMGAILEAEKG